MTVVVVEPDDRGVSRGVGALAHHGFSFGHHHVADRVALGPLTAHNEEHVEGGAGYGDHQHRDVELVTWVLSGALRHTSDLGTAVVRPGQVQHLGAGSGVVHRETCEEPTVFVQAWLHPAAAGLAPCHAVADVAPASEVPGEGGWVVAASGRPDRPGAVALRTAAALLVSRPEDRVGGERLLVVPEAPLRHVFLARGTAGLDGRLLTAGTALHVTDEDRVVLVVDPGAEVHCWLLDPESVATIT